MDGNRRPNYDGCLGPPTFLAPGDPYATHSTHNLAGFFARSGGGLRTGAPHGQKFHVGHGGQDHAPHHSGAFSRSGPALKAGKHITRPATTGRGADSFAFNTGGAGAMQSPSRSVARDVFQVHAMVPKGGGKGGLFSSFPYIPRATTEPEGDGAGGKRFDGKPWNPAHAPGKLFSTKTLHLAPTDGNEPYHMSKYAPAELPKRTHSDPRASTQGTINRFPQHMSDPYSGAHVEYTAEGMYKGRPRLAFVTYKNKTRTAAPGNSIPPGAVLSLDATA